MCSQNQAGRIGVKVSKCSYEKAEDILDWGSLKKHCRETEGF